MNPLVRRYLKTAIAFLTLGLSLGVWMLYAREFGGWQPPRILSAHTHALLVGFVILMITGVALWMFPRPRVGDAVFRPGLAEAAWWCIAGGTGVRVALELGLSVAAAPIWRTEVTRWAHAKRRMLCAREWLAELPFVAAPHGPNWLLWVEALTAPLMTTGLAPADVGQMISIIDGYTRGASDTAISLERARARGISERQWAAAVGADLGRAIGDPRFPAFAELLTAPSDGRPRSLDESFEFGLQCVLHGIEVYVKLATKSRGSRRSGLR
jgi:hypothetical protein